MRFFVALSTLVVVLTSPIYAQESIAPDAATTTITRTVVQATATSIVLRPSDDAGSTSTYTTSSASEDAEISSTSTVPEEFLGAASKEQGSLAIVALAGAAAVAFGL